MYRYVVKNLEKQANIFMIIGIIVVNNGFYEKLLMKIYFFTNIHVSFSPTLNVFIFFRQFIFSIFIVRISMIL